MSRAIPVFTCLSIALLLTAPTRAAEADALAISANIQALHLPYGTILDPIFASSSSTQVVDYTRCGDSAIWTGHYLAAEAFRYQVTQSPDAFNNVKNAIAGIQSLIDVTGTDVLARCLVPIDSPYADSIQSQESSNGIYTNTARGDLWVGKTSRDEYSGVFFGLAVAYDMVPDPSVRASISQIVTRMLNFLVALDWTVFMPDGSVSTTFLIRPDQMLALLQVGQHVNAAQFASAYSQMQANVQSDVPLPILYDSACDDSYFKFNLDFINLYTLIRLQMGPAISDYQEAYSILRNHTAAHQNAFFDIIDRALNGPNAARDNESLALLGEWLSRPRRDPSVDLTGVVATCGSQACQPVPVPLRPPTDFLWQRTPFQLTAGGDDTIEGAGIDYILPYWMARYYGVSGDFVITSAAAPSFVVAPDSLATLYGSNLSLGAPVTLTVQDAAGVQRTAQLLYVSSGQINFVVPSGTAPGPATFTLANGGSAPLTATTAVQTVAPTLFALTAEGSGLAAATAIQVLNGVGQSQVPVFECSASGCAAVPINLGVDTPVYLTLYGTGIRHVDSQSNVTVTINGNPVPVMYAGAQSQFAGLDQVNVPLTLNLRGAGQANIALTVDGYPANIVTIDIQ